MNFNKIKKKLNVPWQYFSGSSPHVAYVSGFHGYDNLGDEAVYDALRGYFPKGCFVDYPKGSIGRLGNCLSGMHCALLAGGTMISGKMSTAVHTQRCFNSCPHRFVFGTGVSLPDFWRHRMGAEKWDRAVEIWRDLLNQCDYLGVRGPDSARVLVEWGVKPPEVIGDPALFFSRPSPPKQPTGNFVSIGLNIAETSGYMYGDYESYLSEYIKLAAQIRQAGWKIEWFVLWPKDLPATRTVAQASGTSEIIHTIYRDSNAFIDKAENLSLFVGTRLHAAALATCAYVPTVSLEYQPKCSDYMKSIDQGQSVIRMDSFSAESAFGLLQETLARRQSIAEQLHRTINMMRNRQQQRAAEIAREIGIA